MRTKPFRLTEVWAKAAYILIAWMAVPLLARAMLADLGVVPDVIFVLDQVGALLAIAVGCRVFRARGEEIVPPRVWWRATGRPTAGFVLFALFVLGPVSVLVAPQFDGEPSTWWMIVSWSLVAAFYLQSSIRLVRGDVALPVRVERDEDARLLSRKRRYFTEW